MIRPLGTNVCIGGSIVFLSLICFSIDLQAAPPERLPPYSHWREMREDSTLRAVAFADQQHGVACGDRGTILTTDDGGLSWAIQNSRVDCRLSDAVWLDDQRVVVVGGGYDRITQIGRSVVLFSSNGGKHWRQMTANDLPMLTKIQRRQDGSLTATGDWSHAMLTDRFQSHDDGKTWIANFDPRSKTVHQIQPTPEQMAAWVSATGMPVAIRDAIQIDDATLFAVGDHGVILVSHDAGRTWLPSRGKGRQTSVLIVAHDPVSVAWGMLGKEAIEHRNRVALLIHQPGNMPTGLANQVATTLGAANADLIDAENSDFAQAANHWVAIHQPSVLVLDQGLNVAAQDAFIQAATAAGVRRVVVYRNGTGSTVIHRDALLPKSGILVSDLAGDAKQLVAPHDSIANSIALQFHYDVAASRRQGDSVTGGVDLHSGQRLTATLPPTSRRTVQIIQARRTQFTRVKRLIRKSPSPVQFAGSLKTILNQTAREDQFRLAWSIYVETSGQEISPTTLALQQIALGEIATRFPTMSAGQWAQLRLDARENSIEWNRLKRLIGDQSDSIVASTANTVPVSPFQEPRRGEFRGGDVRQASAVTPVVTPQPEMLNVNLNRKSDDQVRGVDLAWEYHPLILVSREASRQRGDGVQLQSADGPSSEIKRLAQSDEDDWSHLVRTGGSQSLLARATTVPPKLDGVLDDPCWESTLSAAGKNRIQFSYDDEFLYVAFETSADQIRPDSSATQKDQRSRDQDLSMVDRFQLRIDTDRDLLTSYRFAVSASGQTFDSVDSNRSWNPTWYRQTLVDGGSMTIEMAIQRRDLVDLPIHPGESWYVSPQTLNRGTDVKPLVVPDPSQWMRVDFQ